MSRTRSTALRNSCRMASSPKNCSWWSAGMPTVNSRLAIREGRKSRLKGTRGSKPVATSTTCSAVAGEDADAIEAAAGRDHAAGAADATRRLHADDVAKRRRDAAGAGGVGAQGDVAQPRRHGHRAAAAGAAGDVGGVEHIAAG